MINFYVKQKFISVGNDFEVLDSSGNLIYYFDDKVLAIGTKILVLDFNNREIARIRKKFFSIRPTYKLSDASGIIAYIYKRSFTLRKSFVVDVLGIGKIEVTGKFLEHNYTFYKGNTVIGEVKKKWFRGTDCYNVSVLTDRDALLVLSGVIVIDILCHPRKDSSFKNSKK